MSKASRDKGRRLELEFANRYGGERINDEGLPGPDVGVRLDWQSHPWHNPQIVGETLWEVKGRERIAVLTWLDEATAEGADFLAIRRDGDRNWYVVHPVSEPCPCPLEER